VLQLAAGQQSRPSKRGNVRFGVISVLARNTVNTGEHKRAGKTTRRIYPSPSVLTDYFARFFVGV